MKYRVISPIRIQTSEGELLTLERDEIVDIPLENLEEVCGFSHRKKEIEPLKRHEELRFHTMVAYRSDVEDKVDELVRVVNALLKATKPGEVEEIHSPY